VRCVLVETAHPGNLGAAARAMKTMGLSDLVLVAPRCERDAEAKARASGADDVMARARVVPTLEAALGDCVLAVAATARPREHSPDVFDARGAARELVGRTPAGPVALVFGNETFGLTNEQVRRCDRIAHIPANPAYSSLNLGAAVQVFAYEVRMAVDGAIPAPAGDIDEPATRAEIDGLLAHAEQALSALGFHDPANPKRLIPRLARLAARARLEREEVNILRGVLNWMARPGTGRGRS
jgi:tRNA/rRNA methyltransferase